MYMLFPFSSMDFLFISISGLKINLMSIVPFFWQVISQVLGQLWVWNKIRELLNKGMLKQCWQSLTRFTMEGGSNEIGSMLSSYTLLPQIMGEVDKWGLETCFHPLISLCFNSLFAWHKYTLVLSMKIFSHFAQKFSSKVLDSTIEMTHHMNPSFLQGFDCPLAFPSDAGQDLFSKLQRSVPKKSCLCSKDTWAWVHCFCGPVWCSKKAYNI